VKGKNIRADHGREGGTDPFREKKGAQQKKRVGIVYLNRISCLLFIYEKNRDFSRSMVLQKSWGYLFFVSAPYCQERVRVTQKSRRELEKGSEISWGGG